MKRKPKTKREYAIYRAIVGCKIGKEALNSNKHPDDCTAIEYAIYNLLCAVEDIAISMEGRR